MVRAGTVDSPASESSERSAMPRAPGDAAGERGSLELPKAASISCRPLAAARLREQEAGSGLGHVSDGGAAF